MTPHLYDKDGNVGVWPLYQALDGMESYLNDPALVRYSEQRHRGHTPEVMQQYVKSFDHYSSHIWRITASKGDASFNSGTITAYRDIPNRTANVGILIWDQRNGYGTRAWKMVCDWLLSDGIRKIEAGTMAANTAMLRIFEKTGMHIEATIKDHFILDGKPTDLILAARFK